MTVEEMEKRLRSTEDALKKLKKRSGLLRISRKFTSCRGAMLMP